MGRVQKTLATVRGRRVAMESALRAIRTQKHLVYTKDYGAPRSCAQCGRRETKDGDGSGVSLLSSAISLENHHGNDPLHCWKMDRELRSVHSLIKIGKAVLYGIYYRRPRDLDQFGIIDRLAWEEKYKQLEERRTAN